MKNTKELLIIINGLCNEAIALNESDESLFTGLGIRYRLKSNPKLEQIKSLIKSDGLNEKPSDF